MDQEATVIVRRKADKKTISATGMMEDVEEQPMRMVIVAPSSSTGRQEQAAPKPRWNVRVDYAPDMCKDYVETGYCGFGDSCKFLHDRGDYRMSYQLDDPKPDLGTYEVSTKQQSPEGCCLCSRSDQPAMSVYLPECRHPFCKSCIVQDLRRQSSDPRSKGSLRCPVCQVSIRGTLVNKPHPP
jgi:hypothetical protein